MPADPRSQTPSAPSGVPPISAATSKVSTDIGSSPATSDTALVQAADAGPDAAPPRSGAGSRLLRLGARRLLLTWAVVLILTALAAGVGLTSALDAWLVHDVYRVTAALHPLAGWVKILWMPFVALLLLVAVARMHGGQVLGFLTLLAGLGMVADALFAAVAREHWGAGAWLVLLAVTAASSWLQERRRALHGLMRLQRWMAGCARSLGAQDCATDREALFHSHFTTLCDQHVAAQSNLLADLPPGCWHLEFRGFHRVIEDDIEEMRRDIRRMPYSQAFESGRALWCEEFMAPELGVRSLLMPLMAGRQPVGLWIINVPARTRPADAWLDLVHHLARFLAASLHRRAAAALPPPPATLLERMLAPDRTVPEVAEIARLAEAMNSAHGWLQGLLDDAPVGVLAASLWGRVQYANRLIREALTLAGAGDPTNQEIGQVIMALTGLPHGEVSTRLRDVIATGQPWPFRAEPGRALGLYSGVTWVLSCWIPPSLAPEETLPHRLVLTLAPSAAATNAGLVPSSLRAAVAQKS